MTNLQLVTFLMVLPICGCFIARDVVNPQIRNLDTDWITPGITTKAEIVSELGLPTLDPITNSSITDDTFHWKSSDTFTMSLDIGWIFTPTFQISKTRKSEDILIRFDENDTVEFISRTSANHHKNELIQWKGNPK